MNDRSNKSKIPLYIIIIIIIISTLLFCYTQHKKYVMCVAKNDQLSLIMLNSEIESIIVCNDKNELTQERYNEFKNKIKIINQYIWVSDNLHFIAYEVEKLIDINNKDGFVDERMDNCFKINKYLEKIFKSEHDAMLLYKYFSFKENHYEFIELFGRYMN